MYNYSCRAWCNDFRYSSIEQKHGLHNGQQEFQVCRT